MYKASQGWRLLFVKILNELINACCFGAFVHTPLQLPRQQAYLISARIGFHLPLHGALLVLAIVWKFDLRVYMGVGSRASASAALSCTDSNTYFIALSIQFKKDIMTDL